MAVTQADIDALNAALAAGTRQVTLGGQSVTYQTTASLIEARKDLEAQLKRQEADVAGKKRSRRLFAYHAGRDY